jgi:hypothetical protein
MKKCSEDCMELCSDCIYFNYNENSYMGTGWCTFHTRNREPYDGCDDFYCNIAYQREGWI